MKCLSALLILILFGGALSAQNDFYLKNDITVTEGGQTFINPWAGGINSPQFSEIDLNGDGIKDLFVFDAGNNRIETLINNGTANTIDYHYAPQYISKFPFLNRWAVLKDYNCDGKEDIFCKSDLAGSVSLYRNDYNTTNGLQFTLITDQVPSLVMGLPDYVRTMEETYPTFSDVDKDGDLDILGWPDVATGRVVYYQNKAFEMGLPCDSLRYDRVTDCWGKFQLAFGSNSVSAFNLTCPAPVAVAGAGAVSRDAPSTATDPDSPLIAKRDDTLSSLFAIDIDGDNDDDLLIGDVGSPNSLLVVNGGTTSLAQMVSQDTAFPNYDIAVTEHSFLNHSYIDADNDGKKDLLASAKRENVNTGTRFYKNTSITAAPFFTLNDTMFLQRTMIDLGRSTYPSFFDYDGDGLMDLIVGNEYYEPDTSGIHVGLALFKNVGTSSQPAFDLIDRNFADFNSVAAGSSFGIGCAPTFGDYDGDGDKDMMLGSENGHIFYFINNPVGSVASFTLVDPFLDSIDVGNYSMPCAIDLDRDGLMDLVVGKRNGRINYYRNTGTATNPVFNKVATEDTLGGIILLTTTNGVPGVTGYTAPFIYDDNGSYKLIVGCERGDVLVYDSIDSNVYGTWHLAKTILSKTQGKYTTVAGADLNNDTLLDLAIGNWSGGLSIYYQENPTGINEAYHNDISFILQPNPASASAYIHIDDKLLKMNLTLTVIDQLGRKMLQQKILQAETTIITASYPDGVYNIQLSDNFSLMNKKLVVLH